jgi:hypothetical protein
MKWYLKDLLGSLVEDGLLASEMADLLSTLRMTCSASPLLNLASNRSNQTP